MYLAYFLLNICVLLGTIEAQDLPISLIKEKLNLTDEDLYSRGKNEIKWFVDSNVWQGGYLEGDPLNPHGGSSYVVFMNYKGQQVSPLYACYSECIKPFIDSNVDVLEIGPGSGAWTKAILTLKPKSLVCLDALSAQHNRFWDYIGYRNNVTYIQIKDFLLNELKDDSIDFVFSFGTFCHISSLMCYEYFKHLFKKLRKGAKIFIMYADFDKRNSFAHKYNLPNHRIENIDELSFFQYQKETGNFMPAWSTWYHLGIERAQAMFQELGYDVIANDINVNERDPVVYCCKP